MEERLRPEVSEFSQKKNTRETGVIDEHGERQLTIRRAAQHYSCQHQFHDNKSHYENSGRRIQRNTCGL